MVPERTTDCCPQCAAPLPLHAPAGMCPKCLLEAGMRDARGYVEPAGTTPAPGFASPTLSEIAPHFPQMEILELLGRGGMGVVYKARQKDLDRLVAIKILPSEVGADPAFAERFLREARALAKLSHPNIVTVYDFGHTGGLYYFMMEYVEGTNLRHLMATGELQPQQALAIVPQICEALQFAHNDGVVHRDIKPENILVSRQGHVKIADFGLVKLLGATSADYSLTGTQQVMGTMHYMAPEQVQHTHAVDHRADIYSLGVVFYEMLTGQLPIGRFDPPSKRVSIDARLDEVVLRSLEADPLRRYQQVSDVSTDIKSIGDSPEKPPRTVTESTRPLPTKPTAAVSSRYSYKAILGAAWAPMFFIAVLLSLVSMRITRVTESPAIETTDGPVEILQTESGVAEYPASHVQTDVPITEHVPTHVQFTEHEAHLGIRWWQWLLILAVLLPGLTAPFGTTILGITAISDIRHAQGRLRGLPLAVFDALFYPLLLLDGTIVVALATVSTLVVWVIAKFFDAGGVSPWLAIAFVLLPAIPICLLIDFFIVRAVWKRGTSPPGE